MKTFKNVSEKLNTRKIKKERRSRYEKYKSNVCDVEKAKAGTNPRTVKRHEASLSFFLSAHSMLPWVCSVIIIDHIGRQNVVKTSVTLAGS